MKIVWMTVQIPVPEHLFKQRLDEVIRHGGKYIPDAPAPRNNSNGAERLQTGKRSQTREDVILAALRKAGKKGLGLDALNRAIGAAGFSPKSNPTMTRMQNKQLVKRIGVAHYAIAGSE